MPSRGEAVAVFAAGALGAVVLQSCPAEIDTVAAHRNALPAQELKLRRAFWQAPISAHDAMPREAFVRRPWVLRKYPSDRPWRARLDVAVGGYESPRDGPHASNDAIDLLLRAPRTFGLSPLVLTSTGRHLGPRAARAAV